MEPVHTVVTIATEAEDLMPAITEAEVSAVPTEDATATDPNLAEDPTVDSASEVPAIPPEAPAEHDEVPPTPTDAIPTENEGPLMSGFQQRLLKFCLERFLLLLLRSRCLSLLRSST